jgi:hypothetical protein
VQGVKVTRYESAKNWTGGTGRTGLRCEGGTKLGVRGGGTRHKIKDFSRKGRQDRKDLALGSEQGFGGKRQFGAEFACGGGADGV